KMDYSLIPFSLHFSNYLTNYNHNPKSLIYIQYFIKNLNLSLLKENLKKQNFLIFVWIVKYFNLFNKETFISAARTGSLRLCQWLYENGCPWDERTFAYAAESGNLDLCQWLYEN